jgi:hypothetical protein
MTVSLVTAPRNWSDGFVVIRLNLFSGSAAALRLKCRSRNTSEILELFG